VTLVAKAHPDFHYGEAGQEIFAQNGIRPVDDKILQKYASRFPSLNPFTANEAFRAGPKARRRILWTAAPTARLSGTNKCNLQAPKPGHALHCRAFV
jgi:ABC-type sulfate transport system substrate-binding protein